MTVVLTCVFGLCVVLYGMQVRRAGTGGDRVAGVLHILMAVGMTLMIWPWGMRISAIAYVLVFTACAFFFAFRGVTSAGPAPFRAEKGRSACDPDRHHWYHATMMASMAVMAVLMSTPTAMVGIHASSNTDAMSGMPGMSSTGSGAVSASGGPPLWLVAIVGAFAGLYALVALRDFYRTVQGPHRPVAGLLMSAGMAAAFAIML